MQSIRNCVRETDFKGETSFATCTRTNRSFSSFGSSSSSAQSQTLEKVKESSLSFVIVTSIKNTITEPIQT